MKMVVMEEMFPEEYRNSILGLVEANEGMKTLLGIFYLLKGYTTEEALVKNFRAMTGKDCKDLLKLLRRERILKIGPYKEYLCLSGYEEVFNDIAAGFSPQPSDLSEYFEIAVEEGNKAALKMIELLLKMGMQGIGEFSQYDCIKSDISEMFSPAVFSSLEEEFIKKNLCIYGKKQTKEFLKLYQGEDKIKEVKARIRDWKTNKLAELPVKETVEKATEKLIEDSRGKMKREKRKEKLAKTLGIPETEKIEDTVGYFSGFTTDDTLMMITGNALIDHDKLFLVITDSLSRYEAREWKDFPVIFITERIPKWIRNIDVVFKDAYPKISERKMAIAVPNQVAYSNFKQELLFKLVNQLGIREVVEL
ncbi:hypothetical protein DRN97_00965 [Methanosarcinales archaeon]|nr:MAG: hypothetical protein DRN97_00965 [Methanosarcinales archaeon]